MSVAMRSAHRTALTGIDKIRWIVVNGRGAASLAETFH